MRIFRCKDMIMHVYLCSLIVTYVHVLVSCCRVPMSYYLRICHVPCPCRTSISCPYFLGYIELMVSRIILFMFSGCLISLLYLLYNVLTFIFCILCRPSWLIDSKRIATKIKYAAESVDPNKVKCISNPTKACPRCNHIIDNSDV